MKTIREFHAELDPRDRSKFLASCGWLLVGENPHLSNTYYETGTEMTHTFKTRSIAGLVGELVAMKESIAYNRGKFDVTDQLKALLDLKEPIDQIYL